MNKVRYTSGFALYQRYVAYLRDSAINRYALIIVFCLETGCRISECLNFNSDQILEDQRIKIIQTKTNNFRIVRVSKVLWDSLVEASAFINNPFYFISYKKIYRMVKNNYPVSSFENTKRNNTITHIFRKLAVRIAYHNGLSVNEIKDKFGWKTKSAVMYYL